MATKHETGAVKIPKRRSLERPNWAAGVLSTLWLLGGGGPLDQGVD